MMVCEVRFHLGVRFLGIRWRTHIGPVRYVERVGEAD